MILVDLSQVKPQRLTGVERYAIEATAVLAASPDLQVFVVARVGIRSILQTRGVAPSQVHEVRDRTTYPAVVLGLLALLRRRRPRIVFAPAFPFPILVVLACRIWRIRICATIHDLVPWSYLNTQTLLFRLVRVPQYRLLARSAARVFTVSHTVKKELSRIIAPERIGVYYQVPQLTRRHPHDCREELGLQALPRDYVVTIGTIEPRKNLPFLVRAHLRSFRSSGDPTLVIVGRAGWRSMTREKRGISEQYYNSDRIVETGYVSDGCRDGLLRGAKAFVSLSLYEGFGRPVVEAAVAGIPGILSDIPVYREVVGDSACFVPVTKGSASVQIYTRCVQQAVTGQLAPMKLESLEPTLAAIGRDPFLLGLGATESER